LTASRRSLESVQRLVGEANQFFWQREQTQPLYGAVSGKGKAYAKLALQVYEVVP